MNRREYAGYVMHQVAPDAPDQGEHGIRAIVNVIHCESGLYRCGIKGPGAHNNPLNTTLVADGAVSVYRVNPTIYNYSSLHAGIDATAQTLLEPRYADLLTGLREDHTALSICQAWAASDWGTGQLAVDALPAYLSNMAFYDELPVGP